MTVPNIRVVPASDRHFTDFGWLRTFWLFSFSTYQEPSNMRWGSLRVFNDDVVVPHDGFETHPHEEMEIVSIVLSGELSHHDSLGNAGVIRAGDVQRMSAGTGILHSEFNTGSEPVHFYQLWIEPGVRGLPPSYEQRTFGPDDLRDRLQAVASGEGAPGALTLHTDATVYRSLMSAGRTLTHDTVAGRHVLGYVSSGVLDVDGVRMRAGDQIRIVPRAPLELRAVVDAAFVLVDTARVPGPPTTIRAPVRYDGGVEEDHA